MGNVGSSRPSHVGSHRLTSPSSSMVEGMGDAWMPSGSRMALRLPAVWTPSSTA